MPDIFGGGVRRVESRTVDEEVLDLMFQLLGLLKQHVHAAILEVGLTPQQAHALRALDPSRPVPMRELAAGIMCDASTVTGIVDRLEHLGLVERRPDPDDRRVKGLVVTPAGTELRERIWRQVLSHAPHVAVLSLAERTQLRDQLRRVVSAHGIASPVHGPAVASPAEDPQTVEAPVPAAGGPVPARVARTGRRA